MTNKQPVTFFSKHIITCPSCLTTFQKEELQMGRGRINAGDLTLELRRLYIPTQKYGIVNPLIYPILVCPSCLLAGFTNDFQKISPNQIPHVQAEEENRHFLIKSIFGNEIDFTQYRNTIEGLASYILGFTCTIHLPSELSPTARRGLYSLRAAWLADDLYQKSKLDHFHELSKSLYYQAYVNYNLCLERQATHKEPFDGFIWIGPDIDTNYGYDGLLYTIAYLSMKFLDTLSLNEQGARLGNIKRILSKIFGIGKSTKNKPHILVANAKMLYNQASDTLKNIADKGIDTSIADKIEHEDDKN